MNDQNQTPPKKDKALVDQVALVSFIDTIIRDSKVEYTEEQLIRVKGVLLKEVNEAINSHLVSVLSDKDQLELNSLLDKNPTNEEIEDFFIKKIPSLDSEIALVLLNFRAAYLFPLDKQMTAPVPAPTPVSPAKSQSPAVVSEGPALPHEASAKGSLPTMPPAPVLSTPKPSSSTPFPPAPPAPISTKIN